MAAPINGQHKRPGNLNDGLEVPGRERPVTKARPAAAQPVASRAPTPVTAQPAPAAAAPANAAPETGTGHTDAQVVDLGKQQHQQMVDWQYAMMTLQHTTALNNILSTAASAISKDGAETTKGMANRI